MSVTRFGVSLLNVVATIDSPASHHGTARPETKNSDVLRLARRPKKRAGAKQIATHTSATIQSMGCSCMPPHYGLARSCSEPLQGAPPLDRELDARAMRRERRVIAGADER